MDKSWQASCYSGSQGSILENDADYCSSTVVRILDWTSFRIGFTWFLLSCPEFSFSFHYLSFLGLYYVLISYFELVLAVPRELLQNLLQIREFCCESSESTSGISPSEMSISWRQTLFIKAIRDAVSRDAHLMGDTVVSREIRNTAFWAR